MTQLSQSPYELACRKSSSFTQFHESSLDDLKPPESEHNSLIVTDGRLSLSGLSLHRVLLNDIPNSLREVSLASNRLVRLNLEPLAACTGLKSLLLNGNSLVDLDLSPLASCSQLEKVWVHNNALRCINLDALSSCRKLRSLYLDGNKIDDQTIDLNPLENCKMLRSLRVGRNLLAGELDITPIMSCSSLSSFDVSASVRLVACVGTSSSLQAQSVSSELPPALRRKAANIIWRSTEERGGQSSPGTFEEGQALDTGSVASFDSLRPLGDIGPISPEVSAFEDLLNENRLDGCTSSLRLKALLIGFDGPEKYSVESLLDKHASMSTLCVSGLSSNATPSSIAAAGAFQKCHVVLLRSCANALLLGLHSLDASIPIFVVENGHASSISNVDCQGAIGVLIEPLSERDAIIIRAHALKRARSANCVYRSNDSYSNGLSHQGITVKSDTDLSLLSLSLPTSPVTSSESSPPTGVPTVPFTSDDVRRKGGFCNVEDTSKVSDPTKFPDPFLSRLMRSSAKNRKSSCMRSRVEDSRLSMAFSKQGGFARRDDFGSIAAICGLPTSAGFVLFDAVKLWNETVDSTCELSPSEFVLEPRRPLMHRSRFTTQHYRTKPKSTFVSYEQFLPFWQKNFRGKDCEERLFRTVAIGSRVANGVPIPAFLRIARQFMSQRDCAVEDVVGDGSTSFNSFEFLAETILWYELHGSIRSRLMENQFVNLGLCASILAAESGIFHGMTSYLRSDRMRSVLTAFGEACGMRGNPSSARLTVDQVIMFNMEHGLLTRRAVEAVFRRFVKSNDNCMTLREFTPMWLATNDLLSTASTSYLFSVVDVDEDGYVCLRDVQHFYSEKCSMLTKEGFVPVQTMQIWLSVVDSMPRFQTYRRRYQGISLPELQNVCERDRSTFFQSVLFAQDDLASVNVYGTVQRGDEHAAEIARGAF